MMTRDVQKHGIIREGPNQGDGRIPQSIKVVLVSWVDHQHIIGVKRHGANPVSAGTSRSTRRTP